LLNIKVYHGDLEAAILDRLMVPVLLLEAKQK
jgi:hypothetical protein